MSNYTPEGTMTIGTGSYATSLGQATDIYGDGWGESRNKSQRNPDSGRHRYEKKAVETHHVPELDGGLSAYWLPKP